MSALLALGKILGPKVAEMVVIRLTGQAKGQTKLQEAEALIHNGSTTVEALKKVFGQDFLAAINQSLGLNLKSSFSYEAETEYYIKIDDNEIDPIKLLRDELNINLDRLAAISNSEKVLPNLFRGLMYKWMDRYKEKLFFNVNDEDMQTTFDAINDVISGRDKNSWEMYKTLSFTALGGIGASLTIFGAMLAASVGVGALRSISTFFLGAPYINILLFIFSGLLLIFFAKRNITPKNRISISIDLAYKLLERKRKRRYSSENE